MKVTKKPMNIFNKEKAFTQEQKIKKVLYILSKNFEIDNVS